MVAGVNDGRVLHHEKVGVENKKTQVCGPDIDAEMVKKEDEDKKKEKEERRKKRKRAEQEVDAE